ncbi:hypothetical protein KIPB_013301, partial [Kipferlia bialata]|eukprot:g13301.t1
MLSFGKASDLLVKASK